MAKKEKTSKPAKTTKTAKTVYFTDRWHWDEMVQRDMAKDVFWESSAWQYRSLYLELKP
jgi:starch synthase